MLYAFVFDRVGVVAGELYFVDPEPNPGQEGPEQGVRLEVRLMERGELRGSVYSAQPIEVARPLWRADLLESVARPGTLDRAHHHPQCRGWEPGRRHFDEEMTADPVAWVGRRLADLDVLLTEAGTDPCVLGPSDAADVRAAVPEIVDVVHRLLLRVRSAPRPDVVDPAGQGDGGARVGWL